MPVSVDLDYYELLGVSRDADAKTIKRAFLEKARTMHPDVSADPDAEQKFKAINEAYTVLSDEQKRANYDRYGDPDAAGFGMGDFDVSDIFGDLFSIFNGGAPRANTSRPQARNQGRDMQISLVVTLEEAATGVSKKITYRRMAPCETCQSKGFEQGGKIENCPICHGQGFVLQTHQTMFGRTTMQTPCEACHGSGKRIEKPCHACRGEGRAEKLETLHIDIPSGIHSGQSIRIPQQGEAGLRGAASGDLLVKVRIAEHKRFVRQGDDLMGTIELSALEAMVGCSKSHLGVMPDETIRFQVPAGIQPGETIRIDGAGMPRAGMAARGRMLLVAEIYVPKDLSEVEIEQIKSMLGARLQEVDTSQGAQPMRSETAEDNADAKASR